MTDPRVEKLAHVLINYSLGLKRGQYIRIAGPAVAAPILRECVRAAIRRGAHVETSVQLDGLDEILYKEGSREQLRWVSPVAKYRTRKLDAVCHIRGEVNTRALTGCDPKKVAEVAKANKPVRKIFFERAAAGELRWALTQWPTQASAQDAEMSLAEYEDFVFTGGHLDDADPVATWKAISRTQQVLARRLNRAKEIRLLAADTDLTFSCRDRKWINCCGHENFPDGEVFTGPIEDSVNGHIRFSFPAVRQGREVTDVTLEFKAGKVVKATASKGLDYLKAMIAMDAGSQFVGETAFGCNYNITRYTRNTLFDEKIGGTFHLALGMGYPETGSKNTSGLHWDMVCDLRDGGEVYADGTLIQKNGRFLDKAMPQPKAKRR